MKSPATEVVEGAAEIARLIGRTRRQTYQLLQKGKLPARKVGEQWIADRAKLQQLVDEGAV